MSQGNLLLVQAGGPTQVLNETLCAALDEAGRHNSGATVYGSRRALQGMIRGDLVDLSFLSATQIEQIRRSPGAALGSSRLKPTEEQLAATIQYLRERDIHQAIFIGGNGTMHAAHEIRQFARQQNYELRVMGAPKTIDNDINATDRCPGYASAARYIAQSTRDLGMDLRSLPQPVTILETMGRGVGWVAAASALARRDPQGNLRNDAPHLVYIPEVAFDIECFLSRLDAILKEQGWAVVVVAEGIRDKQGKPVYENADPSMADAVKRPMVGGVARFLAETAARELKIRCRDEKPGLLGRASVLHVAPQDRIDAELVGREAYRALVAGEDEKMVALEPLRADEQAGFTLVPFEQVTGPERTIPREWTANGPLPINERFTEYLRPLVGELLEYEHVFND
jgi:ATP-dependent phosphofructokinase / diphosphate-dependent phosphofructokinase